MPFVAVAGDDGDAVAGLLVDPAGAAVVEGGQVGGAAVGRVVGAIVAGHELVHVPEQPTNGAPQVKVLL